MSFDQAQGYVLLAALGVPFMATVATLLIPSCLLYTSAAADE